MNKYLKYCLIVLVLLVVGVAYVVIGHNYTKIDDKDLKIYFFKAGEADAIVISRNGKHMMIDTGEEELGNEIMEYFKANKITELDYLIITHFDKDHVGSASRVIDSVKVNNVLQNNHPKNSEYYDNYLNSLKIKKIDAVTIEDKKRYEFEDISFNVIGTKAVFDKDESNNSSLIVEMNYRNTNFLFTGDIENPRIKEYLKSDVAYFDFIKMPHHGGMEKKLDDLLEKAKPKYAVITSSDSKQEDEETINLLKNLNIDYYLTRKGPITVWSNGNYIKIEQ